MTTNFQFKSSLIDYTYEGQGYSYTLTPNEWTTIDVDLMAFGQFISLMSDVYSGAIHALNKAKLFDHFEISLSASNGGSGTGGSLEPVGSWDIANSTIIGDPIELPISIVNTYDAELVFANTIVSGGAHTYSFAGSYYIYGGTSSPNVINDFTTTKWFTMPLAGYNIFVLYDSADVSNPMEDVASKVLNEDLDNRQLIYGNITSLFGQNIVDVQYSGPETGGTIVHQNDTDNTDVQNVSVGINLDLGKLYIDNGIQPIYEFEIPTDVFAGVEELQLFIGGVYGSAFGEFSTTNVSFADPIGKPPITEIRASAIVTPPPDAEDGQLWNVSSTGAYDGRQLKDRDSVIFYDDLSKIVAITHPNVEDIVSDAIEEALGEDGQITTALEDLLINKHFNSFAGDWDAGGQYDGLLNFTPYVAATYTDNLLSPLGQDGLFSDGKYYNLIRDMSATINNGLSFDLIIPYISYGSDELVVEIKDGNGFMDLSPNQKFIRFSFINLDISGTDDAQIQLTTTSCDGGEDVVVQVSGTLSSIGDRIQFNVSQDSSVAFNITQGQTYLGGGSTIFTETDAIIYAGYGNEYPSIGHQAFVITQGAQNIILPPEPRLYKTYRAINTDGYSDLYGKIIKENDLVTFIEDNDGEGILVESAADLSLEARYVQDGAGLYLYGTETDPLSIDVISVDSSNIVSRKIIINTVMNVSYVHPGDPFTPVITVKFNTTDSATGLTVGRNYTPNSIYQVVFDTRGGNSIENVVFLDDAIGTIAPTPVRIEADKLIAYTFVSLAYSDVGYGTKIRCIGKMEL